MRFIRNMSLKFKLILLLVSLTGVMLVLFGYMAVKDFERDKIAYVMDSGLAHSRTVALQVRTELNHTTQRMRFLLNGYDTRTNSFHPYMPTVFPSEHNFSAIIGYSLELGQVQKVSELTKSPMHPDTLRGIKQAVQKFTNNHENQEIGLYKPFNDSSWVMMLRVNPPNAAPLIFAAHLSSGSFMSFFENLQMQDTFIITDKNEILISPVDQTYNINPSLLAAGFQRGAERLGSSDGIFEYQGPGTDGLLLSMANLDFGGMKVASVVPRSAALEAVNLIIVKSLLLLGFLLCLTIFLSIISSASLTASLKRLIQATKQIREGNFQVHLEATSEDEVGSLSKSFNQMASEISRLMLETAEKARMENELKTAQLVQSTLFPKDHSKDSGIEIKGYYQPASECSGDWWYYKKIGDKTLFCIGDATGHGVPAALLTAAARSAASAIETFSELDLSKIMSVFNKALYSTAQGQFMMTMFMGVYNHSTGVITYANASHDPPFLLPNKENIKKRDLVILNEANGQRLGQGPDAVYETTEIQLEPGSKVVLYTDGITELKNAEGGMWGERAFIKCLLSCHNEKQNIITTVERLATEATEYRKGHPLEDDVTYFILERAA